MNRIRRIKCIAAVLAVLTLAFGCAAKRVRDDTRLPAGVTIDGVDVSRMTVSEARARIGALHGEAVAQTEYTLVLPGRTVVTEARTLGVSADVESAVRRAAILTRRSESRSVLTEWTAEETLLREYAAHVAVTYGSDPADAAVSLDFAEDDPFVYTGERVGVSVDEAALYDALCRAVAARQSVTLSVPCAYTAPAVTVADMQQMRALISQFTTTFAISPHNAKNRVFNIDKAAALINGTVLEPGEAFDCNAALGDRNEQNGWQLAAGIRSGAYVSEYGGGVCQVSSTLFNAVMMADLSIEERHPHSWPMGYVGIGRDATISTGGKNFRFTNTTGSPLYVGAVCDTVGKTLTVSLFGRPLPDGQYITVSSETIGSLEAPDMTCLLDESLPFNTRVVEREARTGRISRTYKEYRAADGMLLARELAYEDTYRSIDGLEYVSADIYYS